MDYIQEELRRQQEALAAVLLGIWPRQAPEDGRETGLLPASPLSAVPPAASEQVAGTALRSTGARRRRFSAEGGIAGADIAPAAFDGGVTGDGAVRPGEELTAAEMESGGAGPAALRERGRAAPSPAAVPGDPWTATAVKALDDGWTAPEAEAPGDGWTALESGPRAARRGREPAAGAVSPAVRRSRGAPAAERTVTELVYPTGGGAAVTAESLSRAFQRDARRYDGGFAPY